MLISLSKVCSKMVIFLFPTNFGGHFCYYSNGKIKSISGFNNLANFLIKQLEEINEKYFCNFLASWVAKKAA